MKIVDTNQLPEVGTSHMKDIKKKSLSTKMKYRN